jgi:hypothetical protein
MLVHIPSPTNPELVVCHHTSSAGCNEPHPLAPANAHGARVEAGQERAGEAHAEGVCKAEIGFERNERREERKERRNLIPAAPEHVAMALSSMEGSDMMSQSEYR